MTKKEYKASVFQRNSIQQHLDTTHDDADDINLHLALLKLKQRILAYEMVRHCKRMLWFSLFQVLMFSFVAGVHYGRGETLLGVVISVIIVAYFASMLNYLRTIKDYTKNE